MLTRRKILVIPGAVALSGLFSLFTPVRNFPASAKDASRHPEIERWMTEWMAVDKTASGTLHLSRFVEPVYFLTRPITWKPSPGQNPELGTVEVPKGFVTDFASIPRPFWSLLRPDGEYTYPAIIHDYLYWHQDRPRNIADEIFKLAMQDFGVKRSVVAVIFASVRVGGERSWKEAEKLKALGERRILKRFPSDPRTHWQDWKTHPDVFQ